VKKKSEKLFSIGEFNGELVGENTKKIFLDGEFNGERVGGEKEKKSPRRIKRRIGRRIKN
jgi:hypothetical protein